MSEEADLDRDEEQQVDEYENVPSSVIFEAIRRVGPPLSTLDGDAIATGCADFSEQPRARMAQTAGGVSRIHADRETGRLLAAEMCVAAAEHLVHLLALAVEGKMTVADVLAMPFYHPVLEEGLPARCATSRRA